MTSVKKTGPTTATPNGYATRIASNDTLPASKHFDIDRTNITKSLEIILGIASPDLLAALKASGTTKSLALKDLGYRQLGYLHSKDFVGGVSPQKYHVPNPTSQCITESEIDSLRTKVVRDIYKGDFNSCVKDFKRVSIPRIAKAVLISSILNNAKDLDKATKLLTDTEMEDKTEVTKKLTAIFSNSNPIFTKVNSIFPINLPYDDLKEVVELLRNGQEQLLRLPPNNPIRNEILNLFKGCSHDEVISMIEHLEQREEFMRLGVLSVTDRDIVITPNRIAELLMKIDDKLKNKLTDSPSLTGSTGFVDKTGPMEFHAQLDQAIDTALQISKNIINSEISKIRSVDIENISHSTDAPLDSLETRPDGFDETAFEMGPSVLPSRVSEEPTNLQIRLAAARVKTQPQGLNRRSWLVGTAVTGLAIAAGVPAVWWALSGDSNQNPAPNPNPGNGGAAGPVDPGTQVKTPEEIEQSDSLNLEDYVHEAEEEMLPSGVKLKDLTLDHYKKYQDYYKVKDALVNDIFIHFALHLERETTDEYLRDAINYFLKEQLDLALKNHITIPKEKLNNETQEDYLKRISEKYKSYANKKILREEFLSALELLHENYKSIIISFVDYTEGKISKQDLGKSFQKNNIPFSCIYSLAITSQARIEAQEQVPKNKFLTSITIPSPPILLLPKLTSHQDSNNWYVQLVNGSTIERVSTHHLLTNNLVSPTDVGYPTLAKSLAGKIFHIDNKIELSDYLLTQNHDQQALAIISSVLRELGDSFSQLNSSYRTHPSGSKQVFEKLHVDKLKAYGRVIARLRILEKMLKN